MTDEQTLSPTDAPDPTLQPETDGVTSTAASKETPAEPPVVTDPQAEPPATVEENRPEPLPHNEPGPSEPVPEPFDAPASADPAAQEAAGKPVGEDGPAVAADPGKTVVDAPQSAAAPGAEIVGSSEQPLPGAQPGVVADTPVVARTAADPHPEDHRAPTEREDGVKAHSADDPEPELNSEGNTKPINSGRDHLPPPVFDELKDSAAVEFEGSEETEGGDLVPDVGSDYEGAHPSQIPVALRPTPAGPSSNPVGRQRRHVGHVQST